MHVCQYLRDFGEVTRVRLHAHHDVSVQRELRVELFDLVIHALTQLNEPWLLIDFIRSQLLLVLVGEVEVIPHLALFQLPPSLHVVGDASYAIIWNSDIVGGLILFVST